MHKQVSYMYVTSWLALLATILTQVFCHGVINTIYSTSVISYSYLLQLAAAQSVN